MPTSGTGSLWRIITTIAGDAYRAIKIAEILESSGRGAEIPNWVPEPTGHLYMYNTPNYVNENLANPALKLITNFRDPRDLACNQFHWAFQHPMANRTDAEIETFRAQVREQGIDHFVASRDNNILFKSLRALASRVQPADPNVLNLSYSQLCLDFDNLLERIITFLDIPRDSVRWDLLERERTVNLEKNPAWIGQFWSGTDIMPGRYRKELRKETIAILDQKYHENLQFCRALERPSLRHLLATESERAEMERVLVGKTDVLFLKNDANNTVRQITGEMQLAKAELIRIGMAHKARQVFGQAMQNFQYGHAIIPSKEVVNRGLLPPDITFEANGGRPVRQYFDAGIARLWQPFYDPQLLEPQPGQNFYPQTDSHWNHAGAFRYFHGFLSSLDAALADRLEKIELRRFPGRQQGDLGLKLEMPPETIEIIAPARGRARVVFENNVSNEGCVRWYRNDAAATAKRALVLHDSFTLWLLGIIPELFAEAVFFHGTIFDYDFVTKLAPDFVVCLQAERFFVREPETGASMTAYVAGQEREKNATIHLDEFLQQDPRFTANAQ
jgi:hypothetical protein